MLSEFHVRSLVGKPYRNSYPWNTDTLTLIHCIYFPAHLGIKSQHQRQKANSTFPLPGVVQTSAFAAFWIGKERGGHNGRGNVEQQRVWCCSPPLCFQRAPPPPLPRLFHSPFSTLVVSGAAPGWTAWSRKQGRKEQGSQVGRRRWVAPY